MDCGRQRSNVKTLLLQCCALRRFHASDGQNTRDQITRNRSLKRACSNCVLCIPFFLSGSPNECWLHTCDACVIANRLANRTLTFFSQSGTVLSELERLRSRLDAVACDEVLPELLPDSMEIYSAWSSSYKAKRSLSSYLKEGIH